MQCIIRLYEARRRFGLGVSRITYVVDRAGTIAGAFHHEVHIGGHLSETLSVLRTLPAT
jgi:peroxiredoxin